MEMEFDVELCNMHKFIDLKDKKIGRVSFTSYFLKGQKTIWNCTCDCGSTFTMRADRVSHKINKGSLFECLKCIFSRRSKVEVDKKYGRWTVISRALSRDGHHFWFSVRCDCGTEKEIVGCSLTCKRKPSRSCGCLGRKLNSKWVNTTHYPPSHQSKSKNQTKYISLLYATRNRLCAICYREKDKCYHIYGANGFTVCDLWRNGVKDFLKWCMKNNYKKGDAICIKEGVKEFNPENCYIKSKSELISENNSKSIEWNGVKKNITEWAKEFGCTISCVSSRLRKYRDKYGLDKAMDLSWAPDPTRKYNTEHYEQDIIRLYQDGKTYKEITDELKCSSSTITRFLEKNKISRRAAKTRTSLEIEKKKDFIVSNVINGTHLKKIASFLEVSTGTLCYYLKKWGVNEKEQKQKDSIL